MITQIKNKFIHCGAIAGSFLFCLVFLLFHLPVFSQIISEESLDFLESERYPVKRQTEEASELSEESDIKHEDIDSRDPFEPQILTPKKEGVIKVKEITETARPKASKLFALSIQGIIWNSDNPLVIINNKVLKEGEVLLMTVDGGVAGQITIIDIEKDGVTIDYLGEEERLRSPASSALQKGGKNE